MTVPTSRLLCLLVPAACAGLASQARADTIEVSGFTGEAIQSAIDTASPGDVVSLPAGTYQVASRINVTKPLTLRGAATLRNVAVPEWEGEEEPPAWDGSPSKLVYRNDDYTFHMIRVPDGVDGARFEDLLMEGPLTNPDWGDFSVHGRLNAIDIRGPNATVDGCEVRRFSQGVGIFRASGGFVTNSYLHDNVAWGSGYGVVMGYGADVLVTESEFARQRHDVVGNRRESRLVVLRNYFRDDHPEIKAYAVDMHPEGNESATMIVRDNVFRNTSPIVYHAGAGEVTGNFFDARVTDWYPKLPVIYIGVNPSGNNPETGLSHDIYVGHNVHETDREHLVGLRTADYPEGTRWSSWNIYEDGVLASSVFTEHEPLRTSPEPLLGYIYVTDPGSTEPVESAVESVEPERWYDLHAFATDPQGAEDIERIGVQLVDISRYEYVPGNEGGSFASDGNLFVESDGSTVRVRQTPGSEEWTDLAGEPGTWVDPTVKHTWSQQGAHRIALTIRFRLPAEASVDGDWRLHGYAVDRDGHRPVSNWYEEQYGWSLAVEEGNGPSTLLPPLLPGEHARGAADTGVTRNEDAGASADSTDTTAGSCRSATAPEQGIGGSIPLALVLFALRRRRRSGRKP